MSEDATPYASKSTATAPPQREPIYCDCCGEEVLGWRYPDKIVITDRRHGKDHTAVIPLPPTA